MSEEVRLNKYLADSGVCSRREADKLIAADRVRINGEACSLGDKVRPGDTVTVDGAAVKPAPRKVVLAYYKPAGLVVSEKDPHAQQTIFDAIDYPERLTYAGRLDKDSEGLLLLTNDGGLIHAMMQGRSGHEKEYIVHLDREPQQETIEKLRKGVYLAELKQKTKPCRIEKISRNMVRMILTEGLNRQIRRMWEQEGIRVRALKRTRVVTVSLGDLKPGEYCELTKQQMQELYRAVGTTD
ncbi:MAG: rRNA pseudouridine synthase [Lachnospiraceae bacterium]|nr:rRNA pseudouridine synthase [Lachnospiraceae bacterium]